MLIRPPKHRETLQGACCERSREQLNWQGRTMYKNRVMLQGAKGTSFSKVIAILQVQVQEFYQTWLPNMNHTNLLSMLFFKSSDLGIFPVKRGLFSIPHTKYKILDHIIHLVKWAGNYQEKNNLSKITVWREIDKCLNTCIYFFFLTVIFLCPISNKIYFRDETGNFYNKMKRFIIAFAIAHDKGKKTNFQYGKWG